MAHDRNKLVGLAKRLLNHNLNGSTDQADEIMVKPVNDYIDDDIICLLYTSPSPRDATLSRMPSSA